MKARACHLSSVHRAYDIRVFYKECRSLAKAGFDVTLIARTPVGETSDGVRIIPAPVFKNRFLRIFFAPLRMFLLARKQKANLYHFHDPELIVTGLLLRLFTRARVVYDVHEDYKTSIRQKHYLSKGIAAVIAGIFAFFETAAAKCFRLVLAEKYYSERFPKGLQVLNYPVISAGGLDSSITPGQGSVGEAKHDQPLSPAGAPDTRSLLYTGIIAEDRGALLHAELLSYLPDIDVYMVGFCRKALARRLEEITAGFRERFHLEGEDEFVHPARIHYYYQHKKWLAGLAIFPPTSHYMKKELTKIFEYMYAGIPVICSDFPVWRELVQGVGAGVLVDPFDRRAITEAVEYLAAHPAEAEAMGQKGKEAVLRQYNWAIEEEKLIDLYRQLLKKYL